MPLPPAELHVEGPGSVIQMLTLALSRPRGSAAAGGARVKIGRADVLGNRPDGECRSPFGHELRLCRAAALRQSQMFPLASQFIFGRVSLKDFSITSSCMTRPAQVLHI